MVTLVRDIAKNQIIDAVEVLSCYANFLDNHNCAQTCNKKSVDTKVNKIKLYRENEENIWFHVQWKMLFSPSQKKMAKYLSEISEWYFDAINKGHRFYFRRDRLRWEIGKKKRKNRRAFDATRADTSNPLTYYCLIQPRSKSNYVDRMYRARAYVPHHFTTGGG